MRFILTVIKMEMIEELLKQALNWLEEYNKTGAEKHVLLWKAMANIDKALEELEQ